MKFPILSACLISVCFASNCFAADPVDDAKTRLEEFLDYAQSLQKKYSVAGRLVSLVKPDDGDDSRLEYSEVIFRKLSESGGNRATIRFEQQSASPGGTKIYAHSLCLPGKTLHCFDVNLGGRLGLFPDPMTARVDPRHVMDPFTICFHVHPVGLYDDANQIEAYYREVNIYEATYLKGGRLKCRAVNKEGVCLHEFIFEKDLPFIVEMRHFQNPGPKVNYLEVSPDDLKKWKQYGSSKTQWRKLKNDKYVPEVLFGSQHDERELITEEVELRFEDWRFDDKVESDLLDESTFTTETVRNRIDFEELEQLFLGKRKP